MPVDDLVFSELEASGVVEIVRAACREGGSMRV
jgi:hypothetical protein